MEDKYRKFLNLCALWFTAAFDAFVYIRHQLNSRRKFSINICASLLYLRISFEMNELTS